ncbi:unnamed protein product, partial [Mesorhabditis spiculigera]
MWHDKNFLHLPDQRLLCTKYGTICTTISIPEPTWMPFKKEDTDRLAVLTSAGLLYVYHLSLQTVGAGLPHVGQLINVSAAKKIEVETRKSGIRVRIVQEDGEKVHFKVKAENARIWAAKLFWFETTSENKTKNHPAHDAFCCERSRMNMGISFAKTRRVKPTKTSKSGSLMKPPSIITSVVDSGTASTKATAPTSEKPPI